MMRVFINGFEYKNSIKGVPVNIKFVFDDGTVFSGFIDYYNLKQDKITLYFSKWERKNSRICLKFFDKIGIDLKKEGGAEVDENTEFPYPPAFPIFKDQSGLMTRCINRLLVLANPPEGYINPSKLEKDVKEFCSKFCVLDCKECPLKKYKNEKNI